jgi:hypothetical protein
MKRMHTNTGFSGRDSGRPVVCPRVRDIMPGALGRSLPAGGET